MQSTLFVTPVLVLFLSLPRLSEAQTTVTISSNSNFTSAVSSHCTNNCIINISPGITLTMNSGSCQTCTFNGGIVKVSASFNFYAPNSFNNTTLQITSNMTCNTCTFVNDSIHVTSAKLDFQNSPNTITGSNITFSGTASSDAQNVTATNSVFAFSGTSSFSPSGSSVTSDNSLWYFSGTSSMKPSTPVTFKNNSLINMSGSANITGTGSSFALQNSSMTMSGSSSFISSSAVSFTNSSMAMSNSASMSNNHSITFVGSTLTQDNSASIASSGAFDAQSSTLTLNASASLASSSSLTIESGSSLFLNGSSSLASSGTTTVQTNSGITIGDGSSTSTAKMTTGNSAVAIKDNSFIKVSNSGNSYSSTASTPKYTYTSSTGTTTSYSTASQTYNCGTGYPNACSTGAVYGCATMNGSGPMACILLAVADINLSTTAGSKGSVDLSWSDAASSAATEYRVQRSNDSKSWTTIATVIAGGYSVGDYTFSDAGAPAGTLYYRISRIDKDGQSLYSGISTITVSSSSASIRLYPNPTTGRNFFIATPGTGQWVVDVYTMTGQLLTQTQLKGQTQYALQLPARVPAGSAVVVVLRAASQSSSQTFTLLVR